jgi:hypothetical protein
MTDNEKIAQFMGLENTSVHYWITRKGRTHSNELEYDTSWDWLMPVVKKINELMGDYERSPFWGLDNAREIVMRLGDSLCQVDIALTNKEVVQFIDWYNENCKEK